MTTKISIHPESHFDPIPRIQATETTTDLEDLNFTNDAFITLEIWRENPASRPTIISGAIAEEDIISWVSKGNNDYDKHTRILLCPRPHSASVRLIDLPIKQNIYAELARLWDIPSTFPDVHVQFIPIGVVPFTVETPNGVIEGHMLKSEYNRPWEFAAIVLKNARSGFVNAIVFGLKDGDEEERKRLVYSLTSTIDDAFCPLWLPSTLLSLTSTALSLECARTSEALWGVQARTGLHGSAYGKSLKLIRTDEGEPVDVEQCIVDLTAILDQCARFRSWSDTVIRMVDPIREKTLCRADTCHGNCRSSILVMVSQTMKGCQEHLQWFQDSASSHLQTIYQITNQRDSQLNRLISERAQLDGSNMLLIAVMTMTFLPGGFVAAFFSMSIFQFQPGSSPPLVSDWIWLYFVVTIILMGAVFGLWRYLVSRSKHRYTVTLGNTTNETPSQTFLKS